MKKRIETNFFCKSYYWYRRMSKIKKIVSNLLLYDDFGFKKKKYYFLNFIFINDNKIKKLNQFYRKKNKTTDVLTFVMEEKKKYFANEVYCDIFFSAETIKIDAKTNLIDFYDHLTHLIIHCFLHVNGYDHKKNTNFLKMKNIEIKILSKLGVKNPYSI